MTERYKRYKVTLCAHCSHPGGQHFERSQDGNHPHCQLCVSCPGWEAGGTGWWSDERTDSERAKSDRFVARVMGREKVTGPNERN